MNKLIIWILICMGALGVALAVILVLGRWGVTGAHVYVTVGFVLGSGSEKLFSVFEEIER